MNKQRGQTKEAEELRRKYEEAVTEAVMAARDNKGGTELGKPEIARTLRGQAVGVLGKEVKEDQAPWRNGKLEVCKQKTGKQ